MRKMTWRTYLLCLLALTLVFGVLSGCSKPTQAEEQATAAPAAATEAPAAVEPEPVMDEAVTVNTTEWPVDGYEKNQSYLMTYFGIDTETAWTAESLAAALAGVSGAEIMLDDDTAVSVLKNAVIAAGYDELAKSYTAEKTQERLQNHGIDGAVSEDVAPYLACGMDIELLAPADVQLALGGDSLSKEYIAQLLMAVADENGNGRNYMGYSDDPQIDSELDNMWKSFAIFDQPELSAIGKTAVEEGITTGYNLKSDLYNARFLPELTIQYGHSNIKHAHQLLGLLDSEGIVARVQLEPKVSIYQYLLEWGEPPTEATPTYEVRKFSDDLYLAYAVEYDLELEFQNVEDMMRFDEVVRTYAKKSGTNKDAIGVIYKSWWQPLYTTTREGMPEGEYFMIHDCVIRDGIYTIHPFCLDENFADTVAKLNAINPEFQVDAVTRYCNKAFHNYMTGEASD